MSRKNTKANKNKMHMCEPPPVEARRRTSKIVLRTESPVLSKEPDIASSIELCSRTSFPMSRAR